MTQVKTIKAKFGLTVMALTLALGQAGAAEKTKASGNKYTIVPTASEVRWLGKKVTGQHNGTIQIKNGELTASKGALTGGTVVIDMPTIKVLDIKDPKSNDSLTGHLKSNDFFGVEEYPISTFTIKEVKPASGKDGNYKISGDLMIKGATHPVSFPAQVTINDKTIKASAKGITIDRTLYNIRYGSGKFFDNLGDKVIDDKFWIDFDVTAAK